MLEKKQKFFEVSATILGICQNENEKKYKSCFTCVWQDSDVKKCYSTVGNITQKEGIKRLKELLNVSDLEKVQNFPIKLLIKRPSAMEQFFQSLSFIFHKPSYWDLKSKDWIILGMGDEKGERYLLSQYAIHRYLFPGETKKQYDSQDIAMIEKRIEGTLKD